MRLIRVFRQRARSLFRGAKVDAELGRELAYHLEELTRENIAAGMPPAQALLAARRALGGVAQFEEQCRDHRRVGWIFDLHKDFSFAWRMLRKSPGFSALAVLTLALGVGASIAVYAVAEALLLRSLPFPGPGRLVRISSVHARYGASGVGQENFRDWQSSNSVFERMAFTEFSQVTVTGLGDPERVTGRAVSEGFFEMMGVAPRLGRWFAPDEQKPGAARVVILSHAFWTHKLGGRPDAVGSAIVVNDRPYLITGVMPDSFRFNEGDLVNYWTPIAYRSYGRQQHQYAAYARLKPGVTVQAAQTQMTEIGRRLEKAFPDNKDWGVSVVSLRSDLLKTFGSALQIFAAAALIVLLTACGNVASLLLARGTGRSKEIALRLALGAGRGRVLRLLLTESLLLSSLGALTGTLFAFWLIRLAIAAAPPWLQLDAMLSISPTLAAFSILLTLLVGTATGLWPAIRGARADLQSRIKESGSSRPLDGLVAVEIALAVILLAFAGLLTRSFVSLLETDLGYRPERLLTFRMPLPSSRYPNDPARLQFWNKLLAEVRALPGVASAAASDSIPLGGTYSGTPAEVEGRPAPSDWRDVMVREARVTPDYFQTLGASLRSGRYFSESDSPAAEPVLIVNEAFIRKLAPGSSPLDMRVRLRNQSRRIVGVIADARYNGPSVPVDPEAYMPSTQAPYLAFVAIRTAVPESAILNDIRRTIRRLDPELPITQVRTMEDSLARANSLPRRMMVLVAGFAAITLGMAALGLGGVMAYTVSRRRREIGLRIALGARRADISRDVFRKAGRLVLAGSALGILGAIAGTRLLESLLYGVKPRDPVVLIAAPVFFGAVALLACALPATRAASTEPIDALRQE